MGLSPKVKTTDTNTNTDTTRNRGMGFLLVFFPEDNTHTPKSPPTTTNIVNKTTNSITNTTILSKTQSTISICFLLFFTTLLFFTLSTFEPTHKPSNDVVPFPSTALQRMGTLHRRGTRAMNDIVVCHVTQDTTDDELRLFLRLLHRSGITSKSDVVFISASFSTDFTTIVREENNSFLSLVNLHAELNSSESSFDVTRFLKVAKKVEPLWGRKIRTNYSGSEGESTRMSYGSVLSFEASELDPENSLSGFLDRVPMSLRRWACYPMLLGRIRRNFKHVMLVDVKNVIIFNDPLGRVRNRSPDSVFVYSSGKRSPCLVNSAILMGGTRGIRRVSNAMLIVIVRAAMQRRKKNSVSDSAILSQLVRNEFALRNVDLVATSESIPEASELAGSTSFSDYLIIQRGMGNYDVNSIIKKQICSSVMDSFVYSDCQQLENRKKI